MWSTIQIKAPFFRCLKQALVKLNVFNSYEFIFGLVMQEVQKLTTVPELELFLLEHGEEVIDMLGQQVDRIEKNIKVM